MTALRFLPPLVWTGCIAWFSSDAWSAARTGARLLPLLHALLPWAAPEQLEALHWLIRKTAHLLEYAILAGLWLRALARSAKTAGWRLPLALSLVTAALDELHQSTTLTRGGSAADVLLDVVGAAAALVALKGRAARLP
ncbi:MAG TPA: VanZ family protein [Methylomirabilota bacterium]|nr:VanZ family protein [Methylomirabilota bacterium]